MKGKWKGNPKDFDQAKTALIGKCCIVCGSPLILAIIRPPIPEWKMHCNHCGTEMNIAVLLNRKAWKADSHYQ